MTATATATAVVVPNEALAAALAASVAACDRHGRALGTRERLRAALLAAAPHIAAANPDTDAYQRGRAAGLREAADLIRATT